MKKYLPILLLAGALVLSACGTKNTNEPSGAMTVKDTKPLAAGTYTISPDNSQLNWHDSRELLGVEHYGTIKIKSGEVTFDGNSGQGNVTIDMNTINESKNNEALIKHLKSPDFFNVDQFPEAKLDITSITPDKNETNKYQVSGNLTIKDKTNPISFVATEVMTGDTVTLTSEFSIDRTLWDVRFGSAKFFDNLGDKVIGDDINYNLLISANLNK